MLNVVVVVLAPESNADRRRELEERIVQRLRARTMYAVCTLFAPPPARVRATQATLGTRHLVLAWAHDSQVDWGAACRTYVSDANVDGLYLFEISDAAETPLHVRHGQSHEGSYRAVANGFFVSHIVPYGMAPLSAWAETRSSGTTRFLARRILRPGRPDEIEVVRLIFMLFVHEERSRTEILNVLNAERVPAPHGAEVWRPRHVDLILTDPVYVGANRMGRVVAFGVCGPVVPPAPYHLAQARLFDSSVSGESAPGRWSHRGANDHRVSRPAATAVRLRHDAIPHPSHEA